MQVHSVQGTPARLDPFMRKRVDAACIRGIQFTWRTFKKELRNLRPEVQDVILQTLDELLADPVPQEAFLVGHGTGLYSVPSAGGYLLYWAKLNFAQDSLHIVPVAHVWTRTITVH